MINCFFSPVSKFVLFFCNETGALLCRMAVCWNGKGVIAVSQLKGSTEEHNMATSLTAPIWPAKHLKENKNEAARFRFPPPPPIVFFFLRGKLLISKTWVQFFWIITLLTLLGLCRGEICPTTVIAASWIAKCLLGPVTTLFIFETAVTARRLSHFILGNKCLQCQLGEF